MANKIKGKINSLKGTADQLYLNSIRVKRANGLFCNLEILALLLYIESAPHILDQRNVV